MGYESIVFYKQGKSRVLMHKFSHDVKGPAARKCRDEGLTVCWEQNRDDFWKVKKRDKSFPGWLDNLPPKPTREVLKYIDTMTGEQLEDFR